MTLYEINDKIIDFMNNIEVDEETGEILTDMSQLDQLQVAHDEKIENIACFIKNVEAECDAIKKEEINLAKRRKTKENLINRLKNMLSYDLQGSKFETPRCKISFRKSTSTEVNEDEFLKYHKDLCTKVETYKYSKADLKKMVQGGIALHGVKLVENKSISVK
ncbi:MAG TPA: hypothetical protein DCW90_00505 [Lachnospiraceae bacterium]|nr:hypothetical protein [Lachnospiraceae bacterium]